VQKRKQTQVVQALARVGALAQVRELLGLFPDLIDEINKLAPKRRLTPAMRDELGAHVEASTNGSTPKPKRSSKRTGPNPNKRWTAAHRRNFIAAMKRKAREAKSKAATE
jgi:hypothetical protein